MADPGLQNFKPEQGTSSGLLNMWVEESSIQDITEPMTGTHAYSSTVVLYLSQSRLE